MSAKTEQNVTFQDIPQLEREDFEGLLLDDAREYHDRDSFLGDMHMLVEQLIDHTPQDQLLSWYAKDPSRLQFADEWVREYQPSNMGGGGFTHDVLWGGLFIAVEEVLLSRLHGLEEQKLLPWQAPECTYCHQRTKEVRPDLIKQDTCRKCWDEGVDGPWPK